MTSGARAAMRWSVAASRPARAVGVVTWDLGGQDAVMRLSPRGGLEPWKKNAVVPAPRFPLARVCSAQGVAHATAIVEKLILELARRHRATRAPNQRRLEAADGAEPDGFAFAEKPKAVEHTSCKLLEHGGAA